MMDPTRFDHLTRLLGRAGGRRVVLGALLSAALGGTAESVARKRGKDRDGADDRDRDRDRRRNDRGQRLQAARRGKAGKRRKRRKKRGGGPGGGQPEPPEPCCGTEACPDPESGSTSAGCDFAGRSFAGQDLNGSIFRGIDGREANFNQTDNRGSIFAQACLQGATFRNAELKGSTWEDACLFDADFTGADIDDDTLFEEARFCGTVMPDGSVNNRDCGRSTRCCRRDVEPGPDPGMCQPTGDCANRACHTKACQNGQCAYQPVVDGPSPNGLCDTHCCEGVCCDPGATQCTPVGTCCAPNCAGRDCGPDGCGGGGTCGTCPDDETCNDDGLCVCTRQSCPDGCCANGPGNPGACRPGNADGACGSGGEQCVACADHEECDNSACVPIVCTGDCAETSDCPDAANCVCDEDEGACCTRSCTTGAFDKVCGSDGCGGSCGTCPAGTVCNETGIACICTAESCPDGCCQDDTICRPSTDAACGKGGTFCQACEAGTECNGDGLCVCTPQSCPDGCCATVNGPCVSPPTAVECGVGGVRCFSCPVSTNPCLESVCVGEGSCEERPVQNDHPCSTATGQGFCCQGLCSVNDPANCEGCSEPCPPPANPCKVAVCTDRVCGEANAPDDRRCSTPDGVGICCDGVCHVDDIANCGACGSACPTQTCVNSTCQGLGCVAERVPVGNPGPGCNAPGFQCCIAGCADVQNDRDNCGFCGNVCAVNEVCTAGECTCPNLVCGNGTICCAFGTECSPDGSCPCRDGGDCSYAGVELFCCGASAGNPGFCRECCTSGQCRSEICLQNECLGCVPLWGPCSSGACGIEPANDCCCDVGRGATCRTGPQGISQCMLFCQVDAGCPSGAVCQGGFCLYPCNQDADCPFGLRCEGEICEAIQ